MPETIGGILVLYGQVNVGEVCRRINAFRLQKGSRFPTADCVITSGVSSAMSEAPSDGGSQGEDNGLDDYENGSEAGGAGDSSGRGKAKVVWQVRTRLKGGPNLPPVSHMLPPFRDTEFQRPVINASREDESATDRLRPAVAALFEGSLELAPTLHRARREGRRDRIRTLRHLLQSS